MKTPSTLAITLALSLLAAPAVAGSIEVDVTLTNGKGDVRCTLWNTADGFPKTVENAKARLVAPKIEDRKAHCSFADVAPGTYAVSVLHDMNANGDLDTNLVGIPKEPLGFSNGARPKLGPPSFDACKFEHGAETQTLAIKAE